MAHKTGTLSIMGAAYFIVLEREIEGLETGMDGKALSRSIVELDMAAEELGVRALSDYFSMDPMRAAEFMESEGLDPGEVELPALRQFLPEEGLVSIRALKTHAVSQEEGVGEDLRDCERILDAAARVGVRWHFEVDF
jgi:hypothetical protein